MVVSMKHRGTRKRCRRGSLDTQASKQGHHHHHGCRPLRARRVGMGLSNLELWPLPPSPPSHLRAATEHQMLTFVEGV